ncbi:hypothetical protein LZ198_07390 [Myxococcus sp. K15C18031901]|uniref:hypothetical protein n=1 Tax=Myxococcus dinghuensis TaxID=2906761 RepID=UPI0020A7CC6D|nr:hypothetical protein [Myxococcus dinghuensis]MCP3098699.1 hypothetical protein [Myxococcus dinghuensis]
MDANVRQKFRRIQLIAAGATVALFITLALGSLARRYFGPGTLHVVTVGNEAVELLVDGKTVEARSTQGDHLAFEVSRGPHEVRLTDVHSGTVIRFLVDIPNGYSELLLPTREDQCFIRFDMTKVAYAGRDRQRKKQAPTVEDLIPNTNDPITVPSGTYFTQEEMPDEVRSSDKVYLLRDLPCLFANEGANAQVQLLALSNRADELFSDPDALLNDLIGNADPD